MQFLQKLKKIEKIEKIGKKLVKKLVKKLIKKLIKLQKIPFFWIVKRVETGRKMGGGPSKKGAKIRRFFGPPSLLGTPGTFFPKNVLQKMPRIVTL